MANLGLGLLRGVPVAPTPADSSPPFDSFDPLVSGGKDALRMLFKDYAADLSGRGAIMMLALIGWHERQARPGLYKMQMRTQGQKVAWVQKHNQGGEDTPFVLISSKVFVTPCPTIEQFIAGSYDLTADLDVSMPKPTCCINWRYSGPF